MQPKRVTDSALTVARVMEPADANVAGNVHGGVIMKQIDTTAGVVAIRHARSNVVTASIDRLDFHHPVYVGDLVVMKASLNLVGSTSMEVGVRVESENPRTGERRHTASAYLTFVALDREGRPSKVAPLVLESEDEKRRETQAKERRKMRLAEKEREKSYGKFQTSGPA